MDASGGYTPQNLSPRQHDVLKLIVRGLSNKEIASILNRKRRFSPTFPGHWVIGECDDL